MNKVTNKKNQSYGGAVLYWFVGFLLVSAMLTSCFVCGLFAKYTTSASNGNNAHVAGTGVNKLEVKEHKAELKKGDDANYLEDDLLYALKEDEVKANEYEKVLPGVDIPKDPFVRIELVNAEVDYTMYLKVVESKEWPMNGQERTVTYEIDPKLWEEVKGEEALPKTDADDNKITYYKFIGDINSGKEPLGCFDAGRDYYLTEAKVPKYTDDKNEEDTNNGENKKESVIWILKDNLLKVSEHYVGFKVDNNGNFLLDDNEKKIPQKFSLTFEVYLVQVD